MGLKIKEIKGMNKDDLSSKLEELRKELMKVNAQIATGTTPKSPGQARQLKRAIARINMVLRDKEDKEKKDE